MNLKTLLFILVVTQYNICSAAELASTAGQLGIGRINLTGYYTKTFLKPTFQVGTNNFDCRSEFEGIALKFVISPFLKWNVYGKFGIGTCAIEIPYINDTFKYLSDTKVWTGRTFGIGLRYILFPDTIVTPGISVDAAWNHKNYTLSKLEKKGESNNFTGAYISEEIQTAFLIGKKFSIAEPYGGLKIIAVNGKLTDKTVSQSIDEKHSGLAVFIGSKITIYPIVSVICEFTYGNEILYLLGLSVGF